MKTRAYNGKCNPDVELSWAALQWASEEREVQSEDCTLREFRRQKRTSRESMVVSTGYTPHTTNFARKSNSTEIQPGLKSRSPCDCAATGDA